MNKSFITLGKAARGILLDAPVLLTLLLAGLHKPLKRKVTGEVLKIMKRPQPHQNSLLQEYFQQASLEYYERLQKYLNLLESLEEKEKKKALEEKLNRLNNIFPLLEREMAEQLYKSFTAVARRVAKVSGESAETPSADPLHSHLLKLPMIDDPRTFTV